MLSHLVFLTKYEPTLKHLKSRCIYSSFLFILSLLQVSGDAGADGSGRINNLQGAVSRESFSANYHVFQISGTTDPSICEVYFTIQSSKASHDFAEQILN